MGTKIEKNKMCTLSKEELLRLKGGGYWLIKDGEIVWVEN